MKKIWIDTDLGGDIDDALAIILAIAHDDVEILGISTVFENTIKRAKMVKKLVLLAGENIPVYAGIGNPSIQKKVFHDVIDVNKTPIAYEDDLYDDVEIDGEDAIKQLAICLENNEDVHVICIGALTNIADLYNKYPNSYNKISSLTIMGGAIGMNLNEFNITCDPEAASTIFNSNVKKKIISLDVSFKCELNQEEKDRLFSLDSDLMKTVASMNKLWGHSVILHDPLAVHECIDTDNKFVDYVLGNLQIITIGDKERGKIINLCDFNWHEKPREDLEISYNVNSKEFIKYYLNKIEELNRRLIKKDK